MNAFLLLYAMTISIELVLSLLMAVFLYLIVAPPGRTTGHPQREEAPAERAPARTVEGALGEAFAAVSEGRDDLTAITNARALLAHYARETRQRSA